MIADQFVDVGIFPVDDPRRARARRPAAAGGDVGQPERRRRLHARWTTSRSPRTTSTSRSTTASCSAPRSTTTPRWRILANAGHHRHRRRAVLHQRPRHPHPGRRRHRPTGGSRRGERACSTSTARLNYTQNEITHVDPLPQVLLDAGSTEPGLLDSVTVIGIEDERPDWRGTLQANYDRWGGSAPWAGTPTTAGSPRRSRASATSAARTTAARAWWTRSSGTGSTMIKLAVGVRNLFDTYPDQPSSEVVVDDDRGHGEGLQRQLRDVPVGGGLAVRVQRTVRLREDGDSAGRGRGGTGAAHGAVAERSEEQSHSVAVARSARLPLTAHRLSVAAAPSPTSRFAYALPPPPARAKIRHPTPRISCPSPTISSSSAVATTAS